MIQTRTKLEAENVDTYNRRYQPPTDWKPWLSRRTIFWRKYL